MNIKVQQIQVAKASVHDLFGHERHARRTEYLSLALPNRDALWNLRHPLRHMSGGDISESFSHPFVRQRAIFPERG